MPGPPGNRLQRRDPIRRQLSVFVVGATLRNPDLETDFFPVNQFNVLVGHLWVALTVDELVECFKRFVEAWIGLGGRRCGPSRTPGSGSI